MGYRIMAILRVIASFSQSDMIRSTVPAMSSEPEALSGPQTIKEKK